jgi:DNA-binding NarL/FixJ family response regulator
LAAHLLGTQLVAPTHLLTSAEHDVLSHLAQGRKNSQIAASRGSSTRTVANQVSSVLRKLGLPSRAGAAALSIFQPAGSMHLVNASAVA